MSYDFYLFRVPYGLNPMAAYEQQLAEWKATRVKGADRWGAIDPRKEEVKQRLASALIARYPQLELFQRDYAVIAKTRSISEAEARRRYRDLELHDLRLDLQVNLFDHTASVAIAFVPRDRHQAEARLRAVWTCLRVLEAEGGFSTYDSQVGQVLHLDSDFESVLEQYLTAAGMVDRTLRRGRR